MIIRSKLSLTTNYEYFFYDWNMKIKTFCIESLMWRRSIRSNLSMVKLIFVTESGWTWASLSGQIKSPTYLSEKYTAGKAGETGHVVSFVSHLHDQLGTWDSGAAPPAPLHSEQPAHKRYETSIAHAELTTVAYLMMTERPHLYSI